MVIKLPAQAIPSSTVSGNHPLSHLHLHLPSSGLTLPPPPPPPSSSPFASCSFLDNLHARYFLFPPPAIAGLPSLFIHWCELDLVGEIQQDATRSDQQPLRSRVALAHLASFTLAWVVRPFDSAPCRTSFALPLLSLSLESPVVVLQSRILIQDSSALRLCLPSLLRTVSPRDIGFLATPASLFLGVLESK